MRNMQAFLWAYYERTVEAQWRLIFYPPRPENSKIRKNIGFYIAQRKAQTKHFRVGVEMVSVLKILKNKYICCYPLVT